MQILIVMKLELNTKLKDLDIATIRSWAEANFNGDHGIGDAHKPKGISGTETFATITMGKAWKPAQKGE